MASSPLDLKFNQKQRLKVKSGKVRAVAEDKINNYLTVNHRKLMTTEAITNGSTTTPQAGSYLVQPVTAPAQEANPIGELNTVNNELAEQLIDMVQNPVLCRKLVGIFNTTFAPVKPKTLDTEGNAVDEEADETEIKPGEAMINAIKILMASRESASRAIVRRALRGM